MMIRTTISLILFCTLLTGCGGGSSQDDIAGTIWVHRDGKGMTLHGGADVYRFIGDGKLQLTFPYREGPKGEWARMGGSFVEFRGTWSVSEGNLNIHLQEQQLNGKWIRTPIKNPLAYKIVSNDGKVLKLSYKGKERTFERQREEGGFLFPF